MKKLILALLSLFVNALYSQTTLINYNFNSGSTFSSLIPINSPGINSIWYSDSTFYSQTGGTVSGNNAFTANTIAGNSFSITNLSSGDSATYLLNLSGSNLINYKNYKLYFQARRTSTGASFMNISYSLDSINYNVLSNLNFTASPTSTWFENLFDYSAQNTLNFSSKIYFKIEVLGATNAGGTLKIDNFQIQANCNLSNEPQQSVNNFSVSSVGCQSVKLKWQKSDGKKTLIIARANSPITSNPKDSIAYFASSTFGNGFNMGLNQFIVYADSGSFVEINGLNQNTPYFFKIFSYNDSDICNNSSNYLVSGNDLELNATTSNCFDILSILVHACGQPESYNEMFRFKTNNEFINIFDLQVGGSTNNNIPVWGKWPNNNLNFNGFYQSAYTAVKVDSINTTITSCGVLIEPPFGIIPPNSEVIVFTDTLINPFANSFAALSDTLYAVFQKFTDDPSQGCFRNTANGALSASPNGPTTLRNLALRSLSNTNLQDKVTYDASLLVNTNYGTANTQIYGGSSSLNRGATVFFDVAGTGEYVNFGCKAPFIPAQIDPVAFVLKPGNVLCTGDSILLQANPSGSYTSLQWSGGLGGTFNQPLPGVDSVLYIASNNDQGIISFYITVTTICNDTIKDTLTVNVVRPANVSISNSSDTIFCEGGSVTLSANVLNATSYSWNTNATSQNINVNSSGVYSVTTTNWCNSSTDSIRVIVNPNPIVNVSVTGSLTFCEGDSVILNANIQNANAFTWSNGSNNNTLTLYDSITIYAIASDLINNCPSDTSAVYTIIKNKYANINVGNDTSICVNTGPLTIGSIPENGVNYSWTSIPSGFVSNNSLETVNPSTSTLYILEANNNGCINLDSIKIDVLNNINTNISINSTTTSICANDNVAFSSSVTGGGNNPIYQWHINNIPIPTANGSTFSNQNFSDGDRVYCVLTTSLSCASNSPDTSNYILISVKNKPNINIINKGDTTFCQGQNVTLIASNLQSIDNFSWSIPNINDTILVNTSQQIFLYAYNTCGADTDHIDVTVNPLPNAIIAASGPTTFCLGGSVNLNYAPTSGTIFSWSTGSTNNSITVNTGGWIYLFVSNSCGLDKDSLFITVNNAVDAVISATKSLLCNNDSVLLTSSSLSNNLWSNGETTNSIWVYTGGNYGLTVNSITCGNPNASILINQEIVEADFTTDKDTGYVPLEINTNNLSSGAITYNWNFGNGINQNSTNTSVTYNNSGTYTIQLTATGLLGCTDTALKIIRVTDPPVGLEFPNIFTPNNDNQNDEFKPTSAVGITEGILEIYNRWGLLIAEIYGINFIWNGKINEEVAADGVYYYIAKAKTKSPKNPEIEVKGYITLAK